MFSIRDRILIMRLNTDSTLPKVCLTTKGDLKRSLLRIFGSLIALLSISPAAVVVAAETDFAVEHRAAETVLKLGGVVGLRRMQGPPVEVRPGGVLPAEPFVLDRIDFLKGQGLDDTALAFAAELSSLRHFNVANSAISDQLLARVAKIPTLAVLYLQNTPITDVGLESLAQLTKLNAVFINNTFTTDRGVAALAKCATLKMLHLNDTKITDAGLAEVAKLPDLFDCSFEGTTITDVGVAKLSACRNLEVLRVSRTPTTSAGLAFVKDLPKLRILDVQVTKVDDGIAPIVAECPKLKILDLRLAHVSEAASQRLKSSLSNCEVRWSPAKVVPVAPIAGTAPKPAAVYVDPSKVFDAEVSVVAEKLLQAEEYEKLDTMAEKLRDGKDTFPNGSWKLGGLYSFLARPLGDGSDLQWTALIKRCEEWRAARPKSTAAPLVLALAWRQYAWAARGEGYAASITLGAGEQYAERMEKCKEVVAASEWTAEKDPEWFSLAMQLQRDMQGTREEVYALAKKSAELHPTFPDTISLGAYFFYRRWHGKPGELEGYARQAVAWTEKTAGKSLYARIAIEAQMVHRFHIAQDVNFDWETIKQGFEDWRSRFPSDRRLQAFCRMACVYRDRATAARMFAEITGPYDMELWYTQQYIDMMKTWSAPNFESGDQRKVLSPFALRVLGVAWASGRSAALRALSDSPMLAMVDDERTSLLTADTGRAFDVALTPRGTLGIFFDPDSSDIYFATRDQKIYKGSWTESTGQAFCEPEAPPVGVAVVDQPRMLAVIVEGGVLQLFRAADGRPEARWKLEGRRLTCLDSSSKADLIAAGVDDGSLFLHTVKTQAPVESWKVHDEAVHDVAFSPDGRLLVTCTMKEIKLWNVADRKLLGTLEGPQGTAMFKFTADGAMLAGAATAPIAGNSYRLAFWNVADRKLIKLAAGHKGRIMGLAISPDGKTVATSSADTSIRLWDIPR